MVPPRNQTVAEETTMKMTCQAEGHPNNITYEWFKNDVDVHLIAGLSSRSTIHPDGSFAIDNVLRDDTGWYKCRPTNNLGAAPEASAYLNVTCKSTLRIMTSEMR